MLPSATSRVDFAVVLFILSLPLIDDELLFSVDCRGCLKVSFLSFAADAFFQFELNSISLRFDDSPCLK